MRELIFKKMYIKNIKKHFFHEISKNFFRFLVVIVCIFSNFAVADEKDGTGNSNDFSKNFSIFSSEEDRKLQEQNFQRQEIKNPDLPKFPNLDNLENFKEFTLNVSGATQHKFYVSTASDALRLDKDGVVRYVLFIQTKNGGRNLTFEGIRCQTHEWILYATGNLSENPPQWNQNNSKLSQWKSIQNVPVNRYHAALAEDFFCPDGVISNSLEEIKMRIEKN